MRNILTTLFHHLLHQIPSWSLCYFHLTLHVCFQSWWHPITLLTFVLASFNLYRFIQTNIHQCIVSVLFESHYWKTKQSTFQNTFYFQWWKLMKVESLEQDNMNFGQFIHTHHNRICKNIAKYNRHKILFLTIFKINLPFLII